MDWRLGRIACALALALPSAGYAEPPASVVEEPGDAAHPTGSPLSTFESCLGYRTKASPPAFGVLYVSQPPPGQATVPCEGMIAYTGGSSAFGPRPAGREALTLTSFDNELRDRRATYIRESLLKWAQDDARKPAGPGS